MKSKATIKLMLDPTTKNERKTLVLQVIYNRKNTRKSLGATLKITKDDFQRKNKAYKEAYEEIRLKYQKAYDIKEELGENFTFEAFTSAWEDANWGKKKIASKYVNRTIKELYDEYYKEKEKTLSPDTKEVYNIMVDWITKFKSNTRLNDITTDFLSKLTNFIKSESFKNRGKETTDTTIAIYMRGLRAIFNYAIDKGYIQQDKYPFGRNKYKLANKKSAKKALSPEVLKKFLEASPKGYKETLGKDFFILSYALDGLNLADIIRIKNRDIVNNKLTIGRWKTRNSLSEDNLQEKTIIPIVFTILEKYGKLDPSQPNQYVLRFLQQINDDNIEAQDKKKKYLNKNINQGLKSLCKRIEIPNFALYAARHTYATTCVNKGMSIEILSKNLLHTNVQTTQGYVDSISTDNEQKNAEIKNTILQNVQI